MFESVRSEVHDENRQGEAFAPFAVDPNQYRKKFYIESYGCQMNFADSEIVASILQEQGFGATRNYEEADLVLLNTCSIREKAEQTVRNRLHIFRQMKQSKPGMLIGVLGCMAERLKSRFLEEEKLVDMVVGPDAYRTLPALIEEAESGQKAVNVLLSRDETYADISPVRLDSNGITAFVSIMRGCNNMCSFCVVPFTRGRERSRDADSIVRECTDLFRRGFREVTLLGQNVDSYHWIGDALPHPANGTAQHSSANGTGQHGAANGTVQHGVTDDHAANGEPAAGMEMTAGGTGTMAPETGTIAAGTGTLAGAVTFAKLLEKVARISPLLRVRFSTSHPKDITDEVLYTIAKHENICKYIHLPVQSGSTRILQLMNRTYTREWYMARIDRILEIIPGCGLSADIITGFCTETEEDHRGTLSLMEYARYDMSYMFFYSERPGTLAARRYQDDIPEEVKKRRLDEVVKLQNRLSRQSNQRDLGKTFQVLIEGDSKKSHEDWRGRSSENKVIVFPKEGSAHRPGDYVQVFIRDCTGATLLGEIIGPEAKS